MGESSETPGPADVVQKVGNHLRTIWNPNSYEDPEHKRKVTDVCELLDNVGLFVITDFDHPTIWFEEGLVMTPIMYDEESDLHFPAILIDKTTTSAIKKRDILNTPPPEESIRWLKMLERQILKLPEKEIIKFERALKAGYKPTDKQVNFSPYMQEEGKLTIPIIRIT